MFEHVNFINHDIPQNNTFQRLLQTDAKDSFALRKMIGEELPPDPVLPSRANTEVHMTGNMKIFAKSPIQPFALENLLYLEAFTLFTCGSGFYTKRSNYPSYLILYTYDGQGSLEYEGKSYSLSAGDGFFIDCRKMQYYQTTGTHWTHSTFHVNGRQLPLFYEQYMRNGSAVFSQPLTGSYHKSIEQLLAVYSSASSYRDWQASHCITGILTDLMVTSFDSAKSTRSTPENIHYLTKYMEHNFTDNLSLDFLADFSGFSKYYLSREFKKYTGYSPNDYLIQLRIEYAKSLLLTTSLPVNKIAHMCGIHDMNNFTNLFKKKTGVTPGEFRKTNYSKR